MVDEMLKDLTTATVEETTAIEDCEFAVAEKKEKMQSVHQQNQKHKSSKNCPACSFNCTDEE